jgi:hypothetical protein
VQDVLALHALTHENGHLFLLVIIRKDHIVTQIDLKHVSGLFLMRFQEGLFLCFGDAGEEDQDIGR